MVIQSYSKSALARISSLFFCVGILSGCSTSLPTDASSQLDYACTIINGWPVDYATVWPTAVEKHNASPETVSASSYMEDYLNSAIAVFGIDEPEALDLVYAYRDSWELLEMDLISGGGQLPENSLSASVVGDLMQYCDDSGRGFKP
jgi:hypothetical protein